MSQTASAGDPMETARKFSPGLFGIIVILFFLPFVAVTCSGTEMFTLKGLDLVTGTEITEDEIRDSEIGEQLTQFEEGFGGETTESSGEPTKIDMQIFAVLALIAAVVGLITGFLLKGRRGALAAAISGVVGALSLLILRSTFEVEATGDAAEQAGTAEQIGDVVGYDWKLGWTLAFVLFLIAAVVQGMYLMRGRGATSTTSTLGHTGTTTTPSTTTTGDPYGSPPPGSPQDPTGPPA